METKQQLIHPAGKKAPAIDKEKYAVLKSAILKCLTSMKQASHKEILQAVNENFKKNTIKFEGSVEWHLEWVKLDLEAGKIITRIADSSPVKYNIV